MQQNIQFSKQIFTHIIQFLKETWCVIKEINPKTPKKEHFADYFKVVGKIVIDISDAVARFINQSKTTGIFPDKLKIAKVILLFEIGDGSIFDNYRSISILLAIKKTLE